MEQVRIGFAKGPLEGTYKPIMGTDPEDPLEIVVMFAESNPTSLLLLSMDAMMFWRGFYTDIRQKLSTALNLSPDSIIVHSTHDHCGIQSEDFISYPADDLVNRLTEVAKKAIDAALPARMAMVSSYVGDRYSINRRKWLSDDVGVITNWYGYESEEPGGAKANHLVIGRLKRWYGDHLPDLSWLQSPIYYDNPVDPLIQAIEFESYSSKPIGGILRFSAHPHLMLGYTPQYYSADYCGHARRYLDHKRSGIHMFVQGPSGDLVPRETSRFFPDPTLKNWGDTPYGPDGSLRAKDNLDLLRDVRQMGEAIASNALEALRQEEFKPIEMITMKTSWVDIGMREDVPYDSEIALNLRDQYQVQINRAILERKPMINLKRLTDQYNRFHWMQKMLDEWYLPAKEEIISRSLPVQVQAIRMNDVYIAGLPGEALSDTATWLRSASVGDRLVVLTECNGDIGYIAPQKEMAGGDYEVACGLVAEKGERILREKVLEMIGSLRG